MIKCPITNKEIDIGECVTTVDACEHCVSETVVARELKEVKNWRDICRKCEYHDN